MKKKYQIFDEKTQKIKLKLALLGGGKASKFFIEFFQQPSRFPHLDIRIVGVCDINPLAIGFQRAKELGIFTTRNFREFFDIEDLDGIIELTRDREVLLDLIRHSPEGLWVLDHHIARLFHGFYVLYQKLKSKEQEVALEKMVSEFLLQQSHERIVVLNPDFTIVEANEAYLKAVKKPREAVIGGHCYEITHGFNSPCSEWQPEMGCPLKETLKTGKSAHVIHEHLINGEHPTYCDLETYPVKIGESGDIDRVIEIWRDITEELSSRWEMRLNALKTDMEKLVQEDRLMSLGKLSASCVHEINNPIQGLLTFSDLMRSILAKGDPSPGDLNQFKSYLNLMSSELERCGNIVSGLLSFARESRMEMREVELNDILRAVMSLTRHKMELQNIRLEEDLCREDLHIRGDVHQLQQCFLNLIFNAIEAMPEGGELFIGSGMDQEKNRARVMIRDSGSGIAEKDYDHIFDPFFTTKKEGEGTGLGLSIVYGIVKSHGGRIEVRSEPEKGSTFTLLFALLEKLKPDGDTECLKR